MLGRSLSQCDSKVEDKRACDAEAAANLAAASGEIVRADRVASVVERIVDGV